MVTVIILGALAFLGVVVVAVLEFYFLPPRTRKPPPRYWDE